MWGGVGPDTRCGRAQRLLTVPRAPPHLGAERGLLVEIAVHELTVFSRGDLTAGDGEARVDVRGLSPNPSPGVRHLAAAGIAGRMCAPLQGPSQHGWSGQGGQSQGGGGRGGAQGLGPGTQDSSPALGADTAGAAPDLAVHVWEARAVTLGLLRADLPEGHGVGNGAVQRPACLPALPGPLSPPHTHWPLSDVVWPDVGTAGGRLLTGSGSRGWRGQNVGPWHP